MKALFKKIPAILLSVMLILTLVVSAALAAIISKRSAGKTGFNPVSIGNVTAELTTYEPMGTTGKSAVKLQFPPESEVNSGDNNGDGVINSKGADFSARRIFGLNIFAGKVNQNAADINGDGKVNGIDSAILLRYTSGWDGYDGMVNLGVADINGDGKVNGKVNGKDSAILLRYTSGWDGYDKYFQHSDVNRMNYIYVSNEYSSATEGFGKTRFNSIIDANDSITDNSKDKPYTIVVKSGFYNEFEERYGGTADTTSLQGIVTKDYVFYESETPDDPSGCVLSWDGSAGYNGGFCDDYAVKKCIFHIVNGLKGMHTHIKGFTIKSKNTRYGIHMESGGYGRNEEWIVENCIIEYGGRPATGSVTSVIGIGMSPHEKGTLRNVKAFYSEECPSGKRALICHDNYETSQYSIAPAVKAGAHLTIENCDFCGNSARFATIYKQAKGEISETPFVAEIINSVDISTIETNSWEVK